MRSLEAQAWAPTKGDKDFLKLFADYFNNQKRPIAQQQALLSSMNTELGHVEKKCAEKWSVTQQWNLWQGLDLRIHGGVLPAQCNVSNMQGDLTVPRGKSSAAVKCPEKPTTFD